MFGLPLSSKRMVLFDQENAEEDIYLILLNVCCLKFLGS